MFYDVLMEKRAERAQQEKIAVTLPQLRRAYKARVAPHLIRTPKSERRFTRLLSQANKGDHLVDGLRLNSAALTVPKAQLEGMPGAVAHQGGKDLATTLTTMGIKPRYQGQLDPDAVGLMSQKNVAAVQAKMKNTAARDTFIYQGGDTSRLMAEVGPVAGLSIPKSRTPEAREAFNRTVGLHEAAEMKSYRHSPSRGAGPTFASHQGVQPMLNDVNIANTFTGTGAKEFKAQVDGMRNAELLGLKMELKSDPRSVELIEKLQAGGRINRHQRKYLDQQYAKIALGRP